MVPTEKSDPRSYAEHDTFRVSVSYSLEIFFSALVVFKFPRVYQEEVNWFAGIWFRHVAAFVSILFCTTN